MTDQERKEKRRAYYQAHKEEFAARAKRYRETHRLSMLEYQRAYRANNKDRVKQWRANAAVSAYHKILAEKGRAKEENQDGTNASEDRS